MSNAAHMTIIREGVRFVVYVARRYESDNASRTAGNLGYTSLLALVPLVAIALAMLAAFPVFDGVREQIQGWAFANFVPAVGQQVRDYLDIFVANAGRLSAAGIVGLAFTSIMLRVTIESALNGVFRVARDRSALSRLLVYWTVLTLGPLLLGATFSLQGYLAAVGTWALPGTLQVVTAPLPTLLSALAFTVLYAVVPNRRIGLLDALAGGAVAGLLFAALRWAFALYITTSEAYTTVYGAVAAVPIFLLWMFLSWAVVLFGAEVTAALPEWRSGMAGDQGQVPSSRRLAVALALLDQLHRAAAEGGSVGLGRRALLAETGVSERAFLVVLRRLATAGLVAPTRGRRWLLARDLRTVTLWDVMHAMGIELALDEAVGSGSPWRAAAQARMAEASDSARRVLDVPLQTVLEP
jgi:membrane protein